jgi:tetratricopeptide (TPR) repeat protein
MAVVYRGWDLRHDRAVAIKVLRPELAAGIGTDRFLREIRVAARLQHPHILPLLDSGDVSAAGATPMLWYAMPLVEGESLRDRLRRTGQQTIADAVRWTRELADALACAHANGVVHRDVKPENVLLSAEHALLADFGVARALETSVSGRLTETGLALGTPAYMSPEQSLGDKVLDGRSDLYSLGCVLYELLTGEPPYTGPTAQAIVAKRLTDPIPSARRLRETVPAALDAVLERLLAKSPADRYATAAEVADALGTVPTTGAVPVASPPRRRRAALVAAGSALALGGALVALGLATRRGQATAALDPDVIAVLPFRVTAPDRSLDYLGEGLVDLLAVKLDGASGPRAVPPRQLLAALHYRPGMEISAAAADEAARGSGAGRVLDGTLLRTASAVELSATLRPTEGGARPVTAAVSGSLDSLPVLVDRLTARLLAEQGGATTALGELSSTRAIGAYLRGKAAHRQGRYRDAVAEYGAALREDSTFALAALDQISSAGRANDAEAYLRATRLAWTYRARLGPKGQALLLGWVGPKYPAPSSILLWIQSWQQAVQTAPDVPDAWFELGDMQLHYGGLNDLPDPIERAESSFTRALELAPGWVLPLDHLLVAKLYQQDTTGLRALVGRWLAQDTVAGDRSPVLRWRFGLALGDSALVAEGRAGLGRVPDDPLIWLISNAQSEAVGLDGVAPAIAELERRGVTGPRLRAARIFRREWLLNTGHPAAALALTDSLASGEPYPGWAALRRIDDALFWDGDTAAASAVVHRLAAAPGAGPQAWCRLGLWSLHRGDAAAVRAWRSRLRGARADGPGFNTDDRTMCAWLLEAWLAIRERRPEAGGILDRADSLYLQSDVLQDWPVANLVTARLREALGDTAGAARVIGRVPVALPSSPAFRSTYLREQGRIWLEAADTAEGVRALRRFVALRQGADPSLRAGLDSVRARLAALVGR